MQDRSCGIIVRNKKVMFIEQKVENGFFHLFVGGGVEENETPREAVLRELKEEANIEGTIVFGPVTVVKKRVEHMFVIDISSDAVPTPGYDPEFSMDDQTITNILWYDVDSDLDKFTDKDKEYFFLICTEAKNQNVTAEWLNALKKIIE